MAVSPCAHTETLGEGGVILAWAGCHGSHNPLLSLAMFCLDYEAPVFLVITMDRFMWQDRAWRGAGRTGTWNRAAKPHITGTDVLELSSSV